MTYVYYIVTTITTFFAWAYIHEMAHVVAYKRTVGLSSYKLFLWPHIYDNHFYFARVMSTISRQPTNSEQVKISLAPRYPDTVAVGALVLVSVLMPYSMLTSIIVIFLFGGALDMFVGCLGTSSKSDLKIALWPLPPNLRLVVLWLYRYLGLFVFVGGSAAGVYFFTK